jgi:hypothetical protein
VVLVKYKKIEIYLFLVKRKLEYQKSTPLFSEKKIREIFSSFEEVHGGNFLHINKMSEEKTTQKNEFVELQVVAIDNAKLLG